eukprot:TRINITY_DN1953_c0_g1_i2.p1 TRINITY_DN1953_c0_g1~~TRINITY_DN1953_c0_g1_i2.p1  ORF type:complete len:636 (+),score=86.14 TRINITY_DN1953_c0_g1_i2:100-2007(+)
MLKCRSFTLDNVDNGALAHLGATLKVESGVHVDRKSLRSRRMAASFMFIVALSKAYNPQHIVSRVLTLSFVFAVLVLASATRRIHGAYTWALSYITCAALAQKTCSLNGAQPKRTSQTTRHSSKESKCALDDFWCSSFASKAVEPSAAQLHALVLRESEAARKWRGTGNISSRLEAIFSKVFCRIDDDKEFFEARQHLDGGLVFAADGAHWDLRYCLFDILSPKVRDACLSRCKEAAERCQGDRRKHPLMRGNVGQHPVNPDRVPWTYVPVSDVDDTLLPGHDDFLISGMDRSWRHDGSLYPGIVELHRQLRGDSVAEGGFFRHTTVLTARPPMLVRKLMTKLAPLVSTVVGDRLAILPGVGGLQMAQNVGAILGVGKFQRHIRRSSGGMSLDVRQQRLANLGVAKVNMFAQYAQIYPDCAGLFCFFGDDGQADVMASEEMLKLTTNVVLTCNGEPQPVLAFAAIHAVQPIASSDGRPQHLVSDAERGALVERLRLKFPPVGPPGVISAEVARATKPFHRFFYYEDVSDLARQLLDAGWLGSAQVAAIEEAFRSESEAPPKVLSSPRRRLLFGRQPTADVAREQAALVPGSPCSCKLAPGPSTLPVSPLATSRARRRASTMDDIGDDALRGLLAR